MFHAFQALKVVFIAYLYKWRLANASQFILINPYEAAFLRKTLHVHLLSIKSKRLENAGDVGV